jgi:hypothetical protein
MRMAGREKDDEYAVHIWTHADRVAQLAQFRSLCGGLAHAFDAHADARAAELFRVREGNAGWLITGGWTQSDLH